MGLSTRRPSTPLEFSLVIAICWGWPLVTSIAIAAGICSSQFTDADLTWLIGYELIAGGFTMYILHAQGWSRTDLSLNINWRTTLAGGLVWLAGMFISWITLEAGLSMGGDDTLLNKMNASVSVHAPEAVLASMVNGAFEEMLLTAYVFKALERHPLPFIMGVSVLLRTLAHVYQGAVGTLGIFAMGLLFALVYARYRQLWPLIVAHIAWDLFFFMGI